jgi:hypothetical protein
VATSIASATPLVPPLHNVSAPMAASMAQAVHIPTALAMQDKYMAQLSKVNTIQSCDIEKAELKKVQVELNRNKQYFKGLYESFTDSIINENEYKEFKLSYEAKIAELTEKEKRLRDAAYDRIRYETELGTAAESVRVVRDVKDFTAVTVGCLIERIRVFEDKSIKVKFTFLDDEFSSEGASENE